MHRNLIMAVQDQKSHVDGAGAGKGPDMNVFSVDLAVNE